MLKGYTCYCGIHCAFAKSLVKRARWAATSTHRHIAHVRVLVGSSIQQLRIDVLAAVAASLQELVPLGPSRFRINHYRSYFQSWLSHGRGETSELCPDLEYLATNQPPPIRKRSIIPVSRTKGRRIIPQVTINEAASPKLTCHVSPLKVASDR